MNPSANEPIDPELEMQLGAYLDGELDPAQRLALEGRLAASPALLTRLERLRALSEGLGRLPQIPPSSDFEPTLRARLHDVGWDRASETPRSTEGARVVPLRPRHSFLRGGLALGGLAAAAASLLLLLRSTPELRDLPEQGDPTALELRADASAMREPAPVAIPPAPALVRPATAAKPAPAEQASSSTGMDVDGIDLAIVADSESYEILRRSDLELLELLEVLEAWSEDGNG